MSKEYKRKHRISNDSDFKTEDIKKDTKDYIITIIWLLITSPIWIILVLLCITLNKVWCMNWFNKYIEWSDKIISKL